jgi:hypothetical protein
MNKKAILIASLILGLVILVPLVAAAPSLSQNRDGVAIQDRDRDQLRTNCEGPCYEGKTADQCQQDQTCTQDQQCQQTRECNATCNGTCDGDGVCDDTQTQTRQHHCQQECTQEGNIATQYRERNHNRCGR